MADIIFIVKNLFNLKFVITSINATKVYSIYTFQGLVPLYCLGLTGYIGPLTLTLTLVCSCMVIRTRKGAGQIITPDIRVFSPDSTQS